MKSDIRQILLELHAIRGVDFVRQLKEITARREFRPYGTDTAGQHYIRNFMMKYTQK